VNVSERRTALVTGGSRGIGAAITRALAKRGLNVACTYRNSREEAERICADYPDQAVALSFDLGNAESATQLVESVLATWGRLDTVVLNAGMWRGGRIDSLDPTEWWRVLEANVGGNAQLIRAVLPALRKGENASVTFVSSVVGLQGFPGDTAYASAKSALFGFARSLAKEVGKDGIRANVVAPGFVETDMTADIPDVSREHIAKRAVLRRFGTTEEIAAATAFLAEDATYCTGTVLTVDGGWSL
jgi:3-oxoacyl-[acyl-carrier protein] reductase